MKTKEKLMWWIKRNKINQ